MFKNSHLWGLLEVKYAFYLVKASGFCDSLLCVLLGSTSKIESNSNFESKNFLSFIS